MKHIKNYNLYNAHNSQEDLQRLAKDIFANGTIQSVNHHSYSTNNPAQAKDGEFVGVESGSICYVVTAEGFPCTYYVNMMGTTVTNITEMLEY
jgi:hypothetical protein